MILAQLSLFFSSEKQTIYQIMDITKNTPTSEIRKSFREASVKYHPDKNKDPEAKEIFYSLSDSVEILKDEEKREIYNYYGVKKYDKVPKPTAMGPSEEEYKFQLFFQKLMFCIGHIPTYIAWFFIPLAYLQQSQRKTKYAIIVFVLALGALDLGFMTQVLPPVISMFIKMITPSQWLYKTMFKMIQTLLPSLICIIIAYFDIFILKVHEVKESDEEMFKSNIKAQNKFCKKMIKSQEELIDTCEEFIKSPVRYSGQDRKPIIDMAKKIHKQMLMIGNVEGENQKIEGKWTFGKI
eukprot:CAMPEP_0196995736 /NCGR_PEP_ID=MMETSP1380-20130617/1797_1 /TAXON_ID=5936 /ORGANISM="Euplotes crassus, Strain CT5" /LENGTH=294 /DNA_ID=CAMNT_0042411501 /DNA_START=109 /DNA_END=990 /DNA_ORIENTATION=-